MVGKNVLLEMALRADCGDELVSLRCSLVAVVNLFRIT